MRVTLVQQYMKGTFCKCLTAISFAEMMDTILLIILSSNNSPRMIWWKYISVKNQ